MVFLCWTYPLYPVLPCLFSQSSTTSWVCYFSPRDLHFPPVFKTGLVRSDVRSIKNLFLSHYQLWLGVIPKDQLIKHRTIHLYIRIHLLLLMSIWYFFSPSSSLSLSLSLFPFLSLLSVPFDEFSSDGYFSS